MYIHTHFLMLLYNFKLLIISAYTVSDFIRAEFFLTHIQAF